MEVLKRARAREREFELAPSDYVNVSTPGQPVMPLLDEHQFGIRYLAGSAGGVVDEGKGVVFPWATNVGTVTLAKGSGSRLISFDSSFLWPGSRNLLGAREVGSSTTSRAVPDWM
ncbi:MAG: hypothetical protein CM1200mP26_21970 [Acidimicrobiales bacterium]|nr:MAG: hypothetical protein CM1200mP26_21970 [Acidimicrobiales bacterium]